MPVQWVNRPNLDFRGFAGTIAARQRSGRATRSCVLPSGRREHASRASSPTTAISTRRVAGQSVTLTLADEIDVSRGDVLAAADAPPEVADQFEATIVWMDEEPMLPGPALSAEDRHAHGRRRTVTELKYKVNVNTLEHARGQARWS